MFHGRIDSLPLTKGLAGGVYEEHSGYIPPFLEGFRIRIPQITMSCKIIKKFLSEKKQVTEILFFSAYSFFFFLEQKIHTFLLLPDDE